MRTKIALVFTLVLVVSVGWTDGVKDIAAEMADSALLFLRSLNSADQDQASLAFDNDNRYDWHYIPRPGERKGSLQIHDCAAKPARSSSDEHRPQQRGNI